MPRSASAFPASRRSGGSTSARCPDFRSIEFTADNGFFLNGKRVYLRGVCNHRDFGTLGSAFNIRAEQRQREILKGMGINALRASHNPPALELLDLCDSMGILVIDEAFDIWQQWKSKNDCNRLWDDWHEQDLRAARNFKYSALCSHLKKKLHL